MPTDAAKPALSFGELTNALTGVRNAISLRASQRIFGGFFGISNQYALVVPNDDLTFVTVSTVTAGGKRQDVAEHVSLDEGQAIRDPRLAKAVLLPIVVLLPDRIRLTQLLKLPQLALSNSVEAVRLGLSKWTPFQSDEVIVAAHPDGHAGDGAVRVEARYGHIRDIESFIVKLDALGLTPDYYGLGDEQKWFVSRDTAKLVRLNRRSKADLYGFILAGSILLFSMSLYAYRQSSHIDALQAEVRATVLALQQQETFQRKLQNLQEIQTFIAAKTASTVRPTSPIRDIAGALKPDAWIESFQYSGRQGRFSIGRKAGPTATDSPLSGQLPRGFNVQSTQMNAATTITVVNYDYKDGGKP